MFRKRDFNMFAAYALAVAACVVECAKPPVEQVITWLYSKNVTRASSWLSEVVGLPSVYADASHPYPGYSACNIHRGSSLEFFLGVCDIREPPTSMTESSVTVTLVADGGRPGVETWYRHLLAQGSKRINVSQPSYSSRFNVFEFGFCDVDTESLGFYRFQVQTFEDPAWPQPKSGLNGWKTPAAPQQVTWFYTADLSSSTWFLVNVLRFPMVLDQGPCTIHSYLHSRSFFLGVCNSRPAPAKAPPVMYSLVVPSDRTVVAWYSMLQSTAAVSESGPKDVAAFDIFAFEFSDLERSRLGWYTFECLHMHDANWPRPSEDILI
eukprot:TRINITY_DN41705_c0_g1_i1.p1 TRINITY_DN41705_c0_g1~~TRINITY_DN41705_c0_g1_i1.p1  ORF type:complete len:322 (-),score=17.63 TRINITY_DN41705_c0_g1_i1:235-1200(-)